MSDRVEPITPKIKNPQLTVEKMQTTNNNQLQTIIVPRSVYAPFVKFLDDTTADELWDITEAGLNKIIDDVSSGHIPIFEGFKPEELIWPLARLCEDLGNTASESRIEKALKITQLYYKTFAKDMDWYCAMEIFERLADTSYATEKRFGKDSNINKLALETANLTGCGSISDSDDDD